MKSKNYLILGIFLISLFSGLVLVNNVAAQDDEGLYGEIISRGYMVVGSDTTYPPFEAIDPETSLPVGFDVDLATIIADEFGVDLVFKTSAWEPIIDNLKSSQFDMIISAMTITDEREVEVDFTRWYYKSSQAWMVATGNPESITEEADLNSASLSIGVQAGTTSHGYANDTLTEPEVLTYATVPLAVQALKNNLVDVVLGDWAVLLNLEDSDTEVAGTFSPEDFGIAVRTGEDKLRTEINSILEDLLGTDVDDPTPNDLYNAIYYQNFDELNAPGYTGTVTSTALPDVNLMTAEPAGTPGFEFIAILSFGAILIYRRFKK
jgi:ABC-type amino acid transport substrate-binding protein